MAHRLPRLHEESPEHNSVGKEFRRFRIRQPDAHAVRCVRIPDRGHPGAHPVPRDSLLNQHEAQRHVWIADAGRSWPTHAPPGDDDTLAALPSQEFGIHKRLMHEDAVPGTPAVPLPPRPILARAIYPLIIVVAICAVYSQAVRFDFVTYDDYDLISQNTDYLGNLRNLATSFTTHVFSTHRAESAYYRPLLLASFILDYRLWGLNPFGFHLVNILLHAAAAIVLYFLALRVSRESTVSLMTSLLFALHPVQ